MKELVITHLAESERDDAIEYVLNKFGEQTALNFNRQIDRTLSAIQDNPSTFPLLKKGLPLRRILVRKEVSIIYEEGDERIYILSFWNNRRDQSKMKLH